MDRQLDIIFKADVAVASPHHCVYRVVEEMPQLPQWHGRYHIAMAPTKLMDRTEWMLEKVTEIGVDEETVRKMVDAGIIDDPSCRVGGDECAYDPVYLYERAHWKVYGGESGH